MEAAKELDVRHNHVTDAAQDALRLLEPLGRSELGRARVSYALLRTAVPMLGGLLAQQDRAYDLLLESLSAYQQLTPTEGVAEPSVALTPDKSPPAPDPRSASPAEPQPSPAQLSALEKIRRGRVWLKERVVRSGALVAIDPGSRRNPLSTFLALQERGWVDCDTSTTLHHGQRISLTDRREKPSVPRAPTSYAKPQLCTVAPQPETRHHRPRRRPATAARGEASSFPMTPYRQDPPMPTSTQNQPVSIGSINAQRVEDALAQIGPRWTTWSTMVLAQENRPMRVRDVAARLPFLDEQVVFKRLNTMRVDGLVHRDLDPRRGALYRLSVLGESLAPVHRSMSDWSRTHLPTGRMAEAERIEDTLDRLRRRHTTAVIQVLDQGGPMRYVDLAERAGLGHGTTSHRLARLQTDGLVTRTGPRFGDPYALTEAGQALGAVYASVEHWSESLVAPQKPHAAGATRTHAAVPPGPKMPGPQQLCGGAPPYRPHCSATHPNRSRGCRRP